jgi:hypothetical protein
VSLREIHNDHTDGTELMPPGFPPFPFHVLDAGAAVTPTMLNGKKSLHQDALAHIREAPTKLYQTLYGRAPEPVSTLAPETLFTYASAEMLLDDSHWY